ncbi:hypothetical protein AYO40_00745 [Planctomycetaceae bacterium SCGC AG-212-D15]|nr:hypothetical protein AYO40_00745 [Planctomycetaceae bacterium SCGC AG-212-D15]
MRTRPRWFRHLLFAPIAFVGDVIRECAVGGSRRSRRKVHHRLEIESLETRCLLSTFQLFNTGVDNGGALLTSAAVDQHYTVVGPNGGTPAQAVVVNSATYPIAGGPWIGNTATSLWIGPTANQASPYNAQAGTYDYQVTFNLNGFDPTTASITGQWASDNDGLAIKINGQTTTNTHPGEFAYTNFASFTISSGFQAGLNTIDFLVSEDGIGPTGLQVQMTGNAQAVPTLTAYANVTNPTQAYSTPLGDANIFPGTGQLTVTQPINCTATPNNPTAPCDPTFGLTYNSMINPQLIAEGTITLPSGYSGGTITTSLSIDNGSPITGPTITASGPGSYDATIDGTALSPGEHDWTYTANVPTSNGTQTLTDSDSIYVPDSSDSPIGAGWRISGVDQLIPISGGVVWLDGNGNTQFFKSAGNGQFTSPDSNFGTLTQNGDGSYTYIDLSMVNDKETFNSAGLETSFSDPSNGVKYMFAYDGQNRLTSITAMDGSVTSFNYDSSTGLLNSITLPSGTVTLTHDSDNNLTSITNINGAVRSFTYTSGHLMSSQTWGARTTNYSYDPNTSRLTNISIGDPEDYTLVSAATAGLYGGTQGIATITDGNTNITSYQVDPQGRLLGMVQPGGQTQSWSYDVHGDNTSYTDGDTNTTTYQYNAFGQVIQENDPNGAVETYQYTPDTHQVSQFVDGNGNITDYQYDKLGELLSETDGANSNNPSTTNFTYSNELMQTMTDADGNVTVYDYNSLRQLVGTYVYASAAWLQDSYFQTPYVGTGSYSDFQYDPTGTAWTYTSGAGVAGNGSGFTSGNPNAPYGSQVGFLQSYNGASGSISQSVNFTVGGYYNLSFMAAQRGNTQPGGNQTIDVYVDGNLVGTTTPSGTDYSTYSTGLFAVSAGLHTITFQGTNTTGDSTAFVDGVRATLVQTTTFTQPPAVQDAGFEDPSVGTNTYSAYQYDPTGTAWSYASNAGVAGNGSGFTSGNPNAPEGTQVGFLQSYNGASGSISQSIDFTTTGSYDLAFMAAQRANVQPGGNQTIDVLVDGSLVAAITPTGTNYGTYATGQFAITTAGMHTITFEGASTGSDSTAFIDSVWLTLAQNGVQEPSFEDPNVGTNTFSAFTYNPPGTAWIYTGGAGVAGDQSGFTNGNPNSPNGTQVGFLQENGAATQAVDIATAGYYSLSFLAAQRQFSQQPGGPQIIEVLVDGNVVGTIRPVGTDYMTYSTGVFSLTAGVHAITFQGMNTSGDSTAFIDSINLVPVTGLASTETSTYDAAGYMTSDTLGGTQTANYVYDGVGNLLSTTDGDGHTTLNHYDAANNLTLTQDGNGVQTKYDYDAAGNLIDQIADYNTPTPETTQYFYDNAGNLVKTVDPMGNYTINTYNTSDELTETQTFRANGTLDSQTSYQVDANGNTTRTTDGDGNYTISVYNNMNQVAQTLSYDANGTLAGSTSDTYDFNGNVSKQTDGDGNVTKYTYDYNNNVLNTKVYDASNALVSQRTTVLDAAGRQVKTIGGAGNYTTDSYDAAGNNVGENVYTFNPITSSYALTSSTTSAYNLAGQLIASTDGDGNVTNTTYDGAGNVLTQKVFDNQSNLISSVSYTYDGNNQVLTQTDGDGNVTAYAYNGDGNVLTTRVFDGSNTLVSSVADTYDLDSRLATSTDGDGNIAFYTYNAMGQVLTQKLYDPNNTLIGSTTNAYDLAGNLASSTDGDGNTTLYTYDVLGNVLTQKLYDANSNLISSTTNTYDLDSNLLTTINGVGDETLNVYDANRLMSTTAGYGTASAATTQYGYDLAGNQISITDPDLNTTTFTFNALGQVLTTTNALDQTVTNNYDLAGNLSKVVRADGSYVTYAYDGNQLQTEVRYNPDNSVQDTLSFTYDLAGNTLTASNNAGTVSMSYDGNRLITQSSANGVTLTYGYDLASNVTSSADSQGGLTNIVYDGNQVVSKTYQDANNQLRVDFTYDLAGNVLTETRYSDLAGTQLQGTTEYAYDGNELTSITHKDASGNVTAQYLYTYDLAQQLSSETDNGTPIGYSNDATGQLTSAGNTNYGYDPNGVPDGPGDVPGPNNELLSDGTWNYSYDQNGNVSGKVNIATGENWTYTYNDANAMISAVDKDANNNVLQTVTYTYDALGNRISETVINGSGTTTQQFVYDGGRNLYATLVGSGNITTRLVSGVTGPDTWLAQVDPTGANSVWLLGDHLGSVRVEVGLTSGAVVNTIAYDALGHITTTPGLNSVVLFQGGMYDSATGLYHFGARDYNPDTQQWLQQDPLGFGAGDANLRRFVGNSPTNKVDPSGNQINPVQKVPVTRAEPGPTKEDVLALYDKTAGKDPKLNREQIAAGRKALERLLDLADARRKEGGRWGNRCGEFQEVVVARFTDVEKESQEAKDWVVAQDVIYIGPAAWADLTKKAIVNLPIYFRNSFAPPGVHPPGPRMPNINDPGHVAIEVRIKTDPPVVFYVDDWLVGGVGRGPNGSKGGIFFPKDIPSDFERVK